MSKQKCARSLHIMARFTIQLKIKENYMKQSYARAITPRDIVPLSTASSSGDLNFKNKTESWNKDYSHY